MLKKMSNLPFNGTKEQEEKLLAVIAENKHDKSRLMAVMQEAQGIYGYLPLEVQKIIAEGMEVSLEKVYGVAIDPVTLTVDAKATEALRAARG